MSIEQAIGKMVEALGKYLPPSAISGPQPAVSIVRIQERSVGLGNHVGTEDRSGFAAVDLKGIRLDAVVRFQLWAASAETADKDL